MKKAIKGTYGYLKTKRGQVILRTIIFFALPLGLFTAGILATHTRRNLFTVVAVLGCLPACKSLVNTIMYLRASGCSQKAREAVLAAEGRLVGMYDMYFTSYQKNFALSHMVVENRVILGFTEDGTCDSAAGAAHIKSVLSQVGFSDVAVTVTDQLDKYCNQLKLLNEKVAGGNPAKDDEIRIVLYEISL